MRAALLVDLDRFGDVNAALGREAGDELLRQLAPRLRSAARPEDRIEHLGGDGYLILCDGVAGPWEARELASRLATAWAEPFHLGGEEVFVTGSIGVAVGGEDDALLREANAAMHRAKASGRGTVELYDDMLRAGALKRLRLESDFRRALAGGELPGDVRRALGDAGLPPDALALEVTESALMEEIDAPGPVLALLRTLGVRILLDDFGTGYSSLGYLRRFPVDGLKLDRAFVDGVAHPDAAAVVEAIIGMATKLGLQLTAEGVETSEHAERLRALGCRLGQGYMLARPLQGDLTGPALDERLQARVALNEY
jgi:diguanylate cyclase (GGDEF)-like protein